MIKVLARSVPSEAGLLGVQIVLFSPCVHTVFRCVHVGVQISSLVTTDTIHIGTEPTPAASFNLNYLFE